MSTDREFETTDTEQADLGFGKGGVPIYLLLFYLAFLTFTTWYVLEFQLPAFLEEGPAAEALVGDSAE